MLDLFTIFSKGGIVLWCFQGAEQALTSPVNALIKTVILQVRKRPLLTENRDWDPILSPNLGLPDASTGAGTIIAAYPLSPDISFRHKRVIPNFA